MATHPSGLGKILCNLQYIPASYMLNHRIFNHYIAKAHDIGYKGVARGGPEVPVNPLCKPFFKKTTYNIPWRKRHDDNV